MREKAPLVSVIINCHNGEKYLTETINSIYSQTYSNWEIIFWDNASTDKSATIAKTYDSRIKYFCTVSKTSLSDARFRAVKKTKGRYISFLDCDDLWKKDKLEKQIEIFLKDNTVAMVYGLAEIIYDDNKKISRESTKNIIPNSNKLFEGMIFDKLIIEDFIPFPSVLINKNKLLECGVFPLNYNHSIDYWIFLNLAKKYKIQLLNEVCCEYRIHQNNLSTSQAVTCALENIKLIKSFLPDRKIENILIFHYVTLSVAYLKEKKFLKAFLIMCKFGGWNLFMNRFIKKFIKKINFLKN
jgi:glycosyltransferase involved in cell wall biosynthesis